MYDNSLARLGTGTLIKSGGVKLVLWAQTSLREMMRTYKCFSHMLCIWTVTAIDERDLLMNVLTWRTSVTNETCFIQKINFNDTSHFLSFEQVRRSTCINVSEQLFVLCLVWCKTTLHVMSAYRSDTHLTRHKQLY